MPAWIAPGLMVVVAIAVGCGEPSALRRGDELLASGQTDAAIAEYKLARRQLGADAEILLRLGSAYGSRGEVEASLRYFRLALAADTSVKYRVAGELTRAARQALESGSPDNMARALDPLQQRALGLIADDLKAALAHYYYERGDYGQALPIYLALLEQGPAPDSILVKPLWYETARSFKQLGGCSEALGYFETFLDFDRLDGAVLSTARWQYGDCLYTVAELEATSGRHAAARRKLDQLIELGVPRAVLDRGHFLRGELRLQDGEPTAAAEDFRAVLDLNPARSGNLVQLAEQRLREIRF